MKHKNLQLFNLFYFTIMTAAIFSLSALPAQAQKEENPATEIVASGGTFTLEKTVTAGGGMKKENSPLSENGTTGQTAAGLRSTGGNFTLYSGFWTPDNFAPTAANALVSGRVLTANGAGIRNVQITITFPSGAIRTTTSATFGYYRFSEIPVGATYVISVAAKKYTFAPSSQVKQVQDDLQDVDFIADESSLPLTESQPK